MKNIRRDTHDVEVEENREGRKSNRNQQRVYSSCCFNYACIFVVVPTHRLEGRLETMVEVSTEQQHGSYIQAGVNAGLKCGSDIVCHRRFSAKEAMRNEESTQVNHEENENHRTGESHVARKPGAVFTLLVDSVTHRTCFLVGVGQVQTINDVKNDTAEQCELHGANENVADKKFSILVE